MLATSRDLNTVNILGNIVFLLAIISGLWFPFQTLPPWVQAIGRYTPVYYVAELARGLFRGRCLTGAIFLDLFCGALS